MSMVKIQEQEMTKQYTVYMTNFGLNKGSFPTLEEAIAHAKALGFECSINVKEESKRPLHVCRVRPYITEALKIDHTVRHVCNVTPY